MAKNNIIILLALSCVAYAAITKQANTNVIVTELQGNGIGTTPYTAAFTTIPDVGDVFWWFYPTLATSPTTQPLVLWLDGITGLPPSLLANLGMIGPYDTNFNKRADSWIDQCNLLFIDAPIGTGFSTPLDNSKIPKSLDENVEHLLMVLESFYSKHNEYKDAPLYIFGQADGAKSAVALAIKLNEHKQDSQNNYGNIQGIAIGNGIISPALAMTKLGFYLEELGYVDGNGRNAIETLIQDTNNMVNNGNLGSAFDNFISLGDFINEKAGAVAVNIGHIVEKLTQEHTASLDVFGQRSYSQRIFGSDGINLMNDVVAPALGINRNEVTYDAHREAVIEAVRSNFMTPYTDKIEYILANTQLTVSIYNGNLDAVSNTPGQLEWVDSLQWNGQTDFKNSTRQTLIVNRIVEGYFRTTDRLRFFWINAAGQSAPLDNPVAMKRILSMIINVPDQ